MDLDYFPTGRAITYGTAVARPQIYDGVLNPLVLAKLPVRRLQFGKIDAAKLLVLPAKRLRVVNCGVNDVIEIDVLDLKGADRI